MTGASRAGLPSAVRGRAAAARDLRELIALAPTPLVVVAVAAHLAVGVMPVLYLLGIGETVGRLGSGQGGRDLLDGWVVTALAAFLAHQVLAAWQAPLSARIARAVDARCSARLVRVATSAPMSVVESDEASVRTAEAHEVLSTRANTPGEAAEGALALIARYTTLLASLAAVAVLLDPWFAIAGLFIALANRQCQTTAFRRWGGVVRSGAGARRRIAYLRGLATSTKAAKDVRLLGLLPWLDQEYSQESMGMLRPLWSRRRTIYGRPFAVFGLLSVIAAVTVLVWLGRQAVRSPEEVSLAALVVGVQALALSVRFGVIFPEIDVKLVYGRAAWEALRELEATAARAQVTPPGTRGEPPLPVTAPRQAITFEGVRFAYQPGRPVLDGLDLVLTAGTSTALVGVNGAGKSTIVKLLGGLYSPDSGRIVCDDLPLAGHDMDDWRRRFAVTVQDFVRYDLSLRDNVALGVSRARGDDEGIRAAVESAGLAGLLAELPLGIDTPLSAAQPSGRELSGGQWQRLALARSLFAVRHGARVLVLDEPTAQLDARGEVDFYDAFLDLTRGVTSLIISHRFSTVRAAQRIVVLDGGRISEAGSHDELMAADGAYRRMFLAQAQAFALTVEDAR